MNEKAAAALIAAIRRFGDDVMSELFRLKGEVPEKEFEQWRTAAGRALGAVDAHLLAPICRDFPDIVPPEIGGSPRQ
ncbi:MAG: hypothetical protein QM817_25475 [Archangium sp.]